MVPFMGKASIRTSVTYKTITAAISPGQYRLPAPGQGAGTEQAGEDRGDVQQEAAGAGEADQADSRGRDGGCGGQWCGGTTLSLSHVHGHERSPEDQQ